MDGVLSVFAGIQQRPSSEDEGPGLPIGESNGPGHAVSALEQRMASRTTRPNVRY